MSKGAQKSYRVLAVHCHCGSKLCTVASLSRRCPPLHVMTLTPLVRVYVNITCMWSGCGVGSLRDTAVYHCVAACQHQ